MQTALTRPRPRPAVAAGPDSSAAKAYRLPSFRSAAPPKTEPHPAPNAHSAG